LVAKGEFEHSREKREVFEMENPNERKDSLIEILSFRFM
jgi:hypothetical protein